MLQLEAGKYYKNRAGKKVGPITSTGYYLYAFSFNDLSWRSDGREWGNKESISDLIEEWKDEAEDKHEELMQRIDKVVPLASMVEHPAHYGGKDNPYETIKVMRARLSAEEFIGAMKFNIYKYNDRAKQKGCELENYEKALFYQKALVDFVKEQI